MIKKLLNLLFYNKSKDRYEFSIRIPIGKKSINSLNDAGSDAKKKTEKKKSKWYSYFRRYS